MAGKKTNTTDALVGLDNNSVDAHNINQEQLRLLDDCCPDKDTIKKYYKKNVSSYFKDKNDTIKVGQGLEGGSSTTQNLILNIGKLSTKDTIDALAKMTNEIVGLGKKLGHISNDDGELIEAKVKEVIPGSKGVNRMADNDTE